jgi:hypothetical protein
MNGNALVAGIVAWLPMIIVIGIGYLLIHGSRKDNRRIMDMNREIVGMNRDIQALNQTMSDTLLRIEKLLQGRKA